VSTDAADHLGKLPVTCDPIGDIAVDPAGSTLVVTHPRISAVSILDADTRDAASLIRLHGDPVAVAVAAGRTFVATTSATWASCRSSTCTWRARRRGVAVATTPSRLCAPPPTICFDDGQLLLWGVPATGLLVETLLNGPADSDVTEAEAAIERLAAAPAENGLAIRAIWLLRLRALLARAKRRAAAYAELVQRYRESANSLGFQGHIEWAEAM
jgi:hypothetical protein